MSLGSEKTPDICEEEHFDRHMRGDLMNGLEGFEVT